MMDFPRSEELMSELIQDTLCKSDHRTKVSMGQTSYINCNILVNKDRFEETNRNLKDMAKTEMKASTLRYSAFV